MLAEAKAALGEDFVQAARRRSGREARPDGQHAAGDGDRGLSRPIAPGARSAARSPTMVAGHSLGEYTALVAAGASAFRGLPAAGALSRAVDAGGGAGGQGRDGGDPDARRRRGARRLRRGRRRGAGGELQRARPGRDRGREGRGRARDRSLQGEGREARDAAAGERAVPLDADATGGRQAEDAIWTRSTLAAPKIAVVNNVDVAVESEPDADQGRAGAPGGVAGALGRDHPPDGGLGRHAHRRMRAGQGAGRA